MIQLLIYKTAVLVSSARHGDCSIEVGNDYAFSSHINSVPLMTVEFPQAASEYAIIFAGPEGGDLTPAVLLGVLGTQNLFVSKPSGQWDAKYIPAFLRRYPFVFSQADDRFLLCIDEAYPGLNREGRGQRLFDADGKPSPYVENILKFLQEYQTQFLRTQAFCRKIRDLDLLEPMQAQVATESGGHVALGGFLAVSRSKLKALPSEKLAELVATDELELLYLHLQSMRNFDALHERLRHALTAEKPASQSGGNGADSSVSVH
jgi:hypothetical protein